MVSLNFISAQLRGHKLLLTEGSAPQTVWQPQRPQSAIPLLERNTVSKSKLGKSVKDSRSETQSRNLESGADAEAIEGQILTGLLPMACSVCFYPEPRTTSPGLTLPSDLNPPASIMY